MQPQVDEDEALALVSKGAVIVDVRLADDYKVRGLQLVVPHPAALPASCTCSSGGMRISLAAEGAH